MEATEKLYPDDAHCVSPPRCSRRPASSRAVEIPNSGRRAKSAGPLKRREFLLPPDDQILQSASALPIFEPADARQLLAQAQALSGDGQTDDAVAKLHDERLKAQASELVKALGLDLARPNVWQEAVRRLAVIHHGAGRLVYGRFSRPQSCPRNPNDDALLLAEVACMRRLLRCSERDAVRKLAAAGEFPYQPRRDEEPRDRRKRGDEQSMRQKAIQRRFDALRRQYERAKQRRDPGAPPARLEDAFGQSGTFFETMLMMLERGVRLP
jgi:hypothetical protein